MAVGLAWLLGFRFPQNFNSPFKAQNISDFWRRWHMTPVVWMRDYLFIPLGGSRRGRRRTLSQPRDHDVPRRSVARRRLDVRRLGAASTASALVVHGVCARPGLTPRSVIVNRALTFVCVVAAFVIFRAPNLDVAGDDLGARWSGSAGVESLGAAGALPGQLRRAPRGAARLRPRSRPTRGRFRLGRASATAWRWAPRPRSRSCRSRNRTRSSTSSSDRAPPDRRDPRSRGRGSLRRRLYNPHATGGRALYRCRRSKDEADADRSP